MRKLILTALAIALLVGGQPNGAELLYSNGSVDNSLNSVGGLNISSPEAVTDSFTVAAGATLSEAQIGVFPVSSSDTPSTVDWAIGTSKFGDNVSSGTAAPLTNTLAFVSEGSDVYESTFTLSGTLAAGTYWLTLQNGTTAGGSHLLWGVSNGTSSAAQDPGDSSFPSESFQLYGNALGTVPEPTSLVLLAVGISVAAFLRRVPLMAPPG
jgi:hypothetical protein